MDWTAVWAKKKKKKNTVFCQKQSRSKFFVETSFPINAVNEQRHLKGCERRRVLKRSSIQFALRCCWCHSPAVCWESRRTVREWWGVRQTTAGEKGDSLSHTVFHDHSATNTGGAKDDEKRQSLAIAGRNRSGSCFCCSRDEKSGAAWICSCVFSQPASYTTVHSQ